MKEQSVSERRSCQLIGIWRSSYHYQPVVPDDSELVKKGRERTKGGSVPLQATHANHVWTYDFVHSVLEARVKTEAWRQRYNNRRPHSSLGFRTPVQFRDGIRVPLLERGRPSTHHRSREIEMQRRAKKKADLYLQVVQ
jgi:transposase InsO family protein